MAKLSTYERDTSISTEDLLTGSNFVGLNNYNTKNFKLADLVEFFSGQISVDASTITLKTNGGIVRETISGTQQLAIDLGASSITGQLANSDLANSSITINGSAIALGGSVTTPNTQNTTTLSFVDSSNDIILRNTTGGAGSGTDDIKFVAGSNITLTHTDADNITIASSDTQLSTEQVQDIVGAMFSSNTETRVSATYQDSDGTIDLVVDDMTANTQLTTEEVQDIVGGMVSNNTETDITVTYEDGDGTLDFAVGTLNQDTTGTAAKVTVTDSTANTNFPVVFHNESNGLLDDTGALRYNPSTGTLLVPSLSVAGTTTTVDTVTMEAANAIVFEGATPDQHETTLTIEDPTADRTITLPNATGTIALTSQLTSAVSGTQYALPMFATTTTLGDSIISQNAGATQATVAGILDVSSYVQIGSITKILSADTGSIFISSRTAAPGSDDVKNTALGINALNSLANTSGALGNENVAVGYKALEDATTGYYNTVIGSQAGLQFTTAHSNVAIGYKCLDAMTVNSGNVAVGSNALGELSSTDVNDSDGNVAIGSNASGNRVTGAFNIHIGASAAYQKTSGDGCIYIGYNTSSGVGTPDKEIVIGDQAPGNGSNTITLGASSSTDFFGGQNGINIGSVTKPWGNLFAANATFTGNVGIGDSAHGTASLTLKNTSQHIRFENNGEFAFVSVLSTGELDIWGHGSDETINFRTGTGSGTVALDITGVNSTFAGSVVIGTSINTGIPFVVQKTTADGFAIGFMRNTNSTNGNGLVIDVNSTGGAYIQDWRQAASSKMRLLQNGNLGINETDSSNKLQISDSTIGTDSTADDSNFIKLTNKDIGTANEVWGLGFSSESGGTDYLGGFVQALGNFASNFNTSLIFGTRGTSGNATERMRISSLGVVSVGTTSPITDPFISTNQFQQLQVGRSGVMGSYTTSSGETMFSNNIYVGSTHSTFQALDTAANGTAMFLYNDYIAFKIGTTAGNGTVGVAEKMRITSAGQVNISPNNDTSETLRVFRGTGAFASQSISIDAKGGNANIRMIATDTARSTVFHRSSDGGSNFTESIRINNSGATSFYGNVDIFQNNSSSSDFINKNVHGTAVSRFIAQSNGTSQNAQLVSDDANDNAWVGSSTGGLNRVIFKDNTDAFYSGRNFGVGASNPGAISGACTTITFGSTSTTLSGGTIFQANGTNTAAHYFEQDVFRYQNMGAYDHVFFSSNTTELMMIRADGNIKIPLIGVTAGATAIGVDGSGFIRKLSSSKRYKKDIEPIDIGLDFINSLSPVKFKMKEDDAESVGLIAEDMIDNRFVTYSQIDMEDESKGLQVEGVNYQALIAPLIKSIQELKANNDSLKARIEILENN